MKHGPAWEPWLEWGLFITIMLSYSIYIGITAVGEGVLYLISKIYPNIKKDI